MRYISTSAATVDDLKKQAKKLQRKGGGKHADLLNRVARSAGYDHWHHVMLCLKETEERAGFGKLNAELDLIIRAARAGETKIIITGPEMVTVPLVLFTSQGDAWMLDTNDDMAMCLIWQGEALPRSIRDAGRNIEIDWDGSFALDGEGFAVDTDHPGIGRRIIYGYPLQELRQAIDSAQSFDKRAHMIFGQEGAEDLTPELIERLVVRGWEREALENCAHEGARYSPSRNSLLYPAITDLDFDDDEDGVPRNHQREPARDLGSVADARRSPLTS
ncbi:MAG: hypothetical protein R3F09_17125 [Burkholderiaceae bacterium]